MEAHRDRALAESVRQNLQEDRRLAGQMINITAHSGHIRITGTVNTRENKELALKRARGVAGVRNVEDFMDVREAPEDE